SIAHDPVVWRNGGRVRLPLSGSDRGPRPAPLQGFRSVLRAVDGGRASLLLEDAARGAEGFEARALWPRIFARLLAAGLPLPEMDDSPAAAVQVIDAGAFAEWSEAAAALRGVLGERGRWVPRVLPPQPAATVGRARRPSASIL